MEMRTTHLTQMPPHLARMRRPSKDRHCSAPIPLPPALPLGAVVVVRPVGAEDPPAMVAVVLLEETAATPVVVPAVVPAAVAAAATTVNPAALAHPAATVVEVGVETGIPVTTVVATARRHQTRPKLPSDPGVANATRSKSSRSMPCLRLVLSRNGKTIST